MNLQSMLLFLLLTTILQSSSIIIEGLADQQTKPKNNVSILKPPGKNIPAFPQQTPHSGAHFRHTHPSDQCLVNDNDNDDDDDAVEDYLYENGKEMVKKKKWGLGARSKFRMRGKRRFKSRRFFEGWYYRVTLPEYNHSFVFIFSIEDPFVGGGENGGKNLTLAACQVMGPNDEYLVQADPDDTKFWAWTEQQGLGCTFEWKDSNTNFEEGKEGALFPEDWRAKVKTGFQMLPTSLIGRIAGHDGSKGGVKDGQGIPGDCSWDLKLDPFFGWGTSRQFSTAGWLASYPVFEPHWQITMADAKASGTITWKGETFTFEDAPFYA